jgi:hypothetical protein
MKKLIMLVFSAMIVEFAFVGVSNAKDPNHPKFDPNTYFGRVIVTKDAKGDITLVQFESKRRGTFNIVLNEKGKELAEKMDGKMVVITGTVTVKDNIKWLTVEKYNELQRPLHRHGHGDPNGPPDGDPNRPHHGPPQGHGDEGDR